MGVSCLSVVAVRGWGWWPGVGGGAGGVVWPGAGGAPGRVGAPRPGGPLYDVPI